MFVGVDGEYRVNSVYVGGEELDPEKIYTLAIDEYYYYSDGDGMTMFKDCNALVTREDKVIDHDLVIDYLASLDGTVGEEYKDIGGQGRITILEEAEENEEKAEEETEEIVKESAEEETEENVEREEESKGRINPVVYGAVIILVIAVLLFASKKWIVKKKEN